MKNLLARRWAELSILLVLALCALPALPRRTAPTILGFWDISGKFGVHPHGKVEFVSYREMFIINPDGTCITLFGLPGIWKLSGSKFTVTIDPFAARDYLTQLGTGQGLAATNVSNFVLTATFKDNKLSDGKITGTAYMSNLAKGKRNQSYRLDGKFAGGHGQPFPTPTPTPIPTPTPTPIIIVVTPTPTPTPTPRAAKLSSTVRPAPNPQEDFADVLVHALPGAAEGRN